MPIFLSKKRLSFYKNEPVGNTAFGRVPICVMSVKVFSRKDPTMQPLVCFCCPSPRFTGGNVIRQFSAALISVYSMTSKWVGPLNEQLSYRQIRLMLFEEAPNLFIREDPAQEKCCSNGIFPNSQTRPR